jgi:CRP/FNR family transcriptional regulator, cyclic AMP receptor protein
MSRFNQTRREEQNMGENMDRGGAGGRAELEAQVVAHPFLAGMSETHMRFLTDCAMRSHFQAGELIFREGDTANRFYLIEQGKVALEASTLGQPVRIDEIGDGDLLGWSWLFPPYAWHFTARAIENTSAIFFYGTVLREYCERDHSLGFELFRRMSAVMLRRLQGARQKLLTEGKPRPN